MGVGGTVEGLKGAWLLRARCCALPGRACGGPHAPAECCAVRPPPRPPPPSRPPSHDLLVTRFFLGLACGRGCQPCLAVTPARLQAPIAHHTIRIALKERCLPLPGTPRCPLLAQVALAVADEELAPTVPDNFDVDVQVRAGGRLGASGLRLPGCRCACEDGAHLTGSVGPGGTAGGRGRAEVQWGGGCPLVMETPYARCDSGQLGCVRGSEALCTPMAPSGHRHHHHDDVMTLAASHDRLHDQGAARRPG